MKKENEGPLVTQTSEDEAGLPGVSPREDPAPELLAEVAALREGLEAIDQGCVRPFKEYMAEHRQRYPDIALGA